jgi:hypothetical protein
MPAVVNTYKVHAGKEVSGKGGGHIVVLYVQAAAGDFETLKAVIVANGSVPGPGTVQIYSSQQVTPTAQIA